MTDTIAICNDCGSDYLYDPDEAKDYSNGCPFCGEVIYVTYRVVIERQVLPSKAEEFESEHADLPEPLEFSYDSHIDWRHESHELHNVVAVERVEEEA